jgi:hypothetical protein
MRTSIVTYRITHRNLVIFTFLFLLSVAPAAFAQAAPVCGVPGTPACTPTPRPTERPTTAPTTVPSVQQPTQPTIEPTLEPTPTEAPLIALPATGPCVAAPNGNFRVNVRDWPGEIGAITGVLTPDDAVEAGPRVRVFDGSSAWIALNGGGFISESALRFGGEDCEELPEIEIPDSHEPFVLSHDVDEDGETDMQLILRAPNRDETADDVCIIYNYHNPHGGSGEICLPFDISGSAVVCIDGHCIVVEETASTEFEPEFHIAAGVVVPPVDEDGIQNSNLFIVFPGEPEATANVYHGPFDPDICIEHTVGNPYTGKGMTMCISADVSAGDVYCEGGHCVPVWD